MPTSEKRATDSLLERARGGSRSALNLLMESCRPRLRRKARSALPAALDRKQDASDMVQECQLVGAARFGEFRGHSLAEFRDWIEKILKNVIFHELRFWRRQKRDRKREQFLANDGGGSGEPAGSSTSLLERLSRKEEWNRLMAAAGWCREEDLAVIRLHFFQGRSHEEIAAAWNISSPSVRQRSCRAVRRIGEAARLQSLMARDRIPGPQQDVIGIHLFQDADAATIAERLLLPQQLVARWIAQATPLFRELAEAKP
jgi:RNA polymerase sigma factor (sigma-70 family)